jgi:hypothetical protein
VPKSVIIFGSDCAILAPYDSGPKNIDRNFLNYFLLDQLRMFAEPASCKEISAARRAAEQTL